MPHIAHFPRPGESDPYAVLQLGVSNVTRRVCAKSKFWQCAKKERQNMDKSDTLQDLPFSVNEDDKRERS